MSDGNDARRLLVIHELAERKRYRLPHMRRLLLAWLVVGTLDISEVCILAAIRGTSTPTRILQSVATGWLGKAAFQGGTSTMLLGLASHFLIAFLVVSIYFIASRRIPVLQQHPIISGIVYGLGVWVVMNFVVLRLSAAGIPHFTRVSLLNGFFTHIFCIGIPTALLTRERK